MADVKQSDNGELPDQSKATPNALVRYSPNGPWFPAVRNPDGTYSLPGTDEQTREIEGKDATPEEIARAEVELDRQITDGPKAEPPSALTPEEAGQEPFDEVEDWSPTTPGEFGPAVSYVHMERDGVVVEGAFNPYTGQGLMELLDKLRDGLFHARASGTLPPADLIDKTVPVNALRMERAVAAGHEFDPDVPNSRCLNCSKAQWACLEGEPCEPKTETANGAIVDDPAQEAAE